MADDKINAFNAQRPGRTRVDAIHRWDPPRGNLCGAQLGDSSTCAEHVTCEECKQLMTAARSSAATVPSTDARVAALEAAQAELQQKVRGLERNSNRPSAAKAASMPPWFGVFVTGTVDPLVATFEYPDQAHRFVRDHYKDRAEVREVPAPGAQVVNEADLRGHITALEARLRVVEDERGVLLKMLKRVACQLSIESPLCRDVEEALRKSGVDPATMRASPSASVRPVGAP